MKKILYVDMDNVLVDFSSGLSRTEKSILKKYKDNLDEIPGIFALMDPLEGSLEAYRLLADKYDTYILSTSPWNNPTAASDKFIWVKKHLGDVAYKRLIISHHKHLNKGDYLIDDREKNGASEFTGELLLFGSDKFPNWNSVIEYLLKNI